MMQFKYNHKKESNKAHLDKYYTPANIAQHCISVAFDKIGRDNISHVVDPSAGNGAFSSLIPDCLAIDIEPDGDGIIRGDFLNLEMKYKKGRLIITNPPFGTRMILVKKFFKKAVSIGDFIAFILPISQLNNEYSEMYEFDLIHSEDLGMVDYSGYTVHCCFNIYSRPKSGKLNNKNVAKLNDIEILKESSIKFKECKDWDVRMCYWGNGSAGKILADGDSSYSGEWKILVKKKSLLPKILSVLTNVDWHKEIPRVSMLKIQKYHLVKVLKREIPEIE